jgi:hypothetical protein
MTFRRRSNRTGSDALQLTGSLLIGGIGGYPGYRLTITPSRVSIAPRSRLMNMLMPAFEFPWEAVLSVSGDTGPLGLRLQLHFALNQPADVSGGVFPGLWQRFIRRPGFELSQKKFVEALRAIPGEVPHWTP